MINLIPLILLMEDSNNMENIDEELEILKMKKKKIKQMQDRKLRLRSNNCGKSNINQRVSLNFRRFADYINERREENGWDCLSYPKISELIVMHKKYSKRVQNDIINYNTLLDEDEENNKEEFNDK